VLPRPPGATEVQAAAGDHQEAGRGEEERRLPAVRHDPQGRGRPPPEGHHGDGDLSGMRPRAGGASQSTAVAVAAVAVAVAVAVVMAVAAMEISTPKDKQRGDEGYCMFS